MGKQDIQIIKDVIEKERGGVKERKTVIPSNLEDTKSRPGGHKEGASTKHLKITRL